MLTPDVAEPTGVNKIDPGLAPIESSLSWLGMPGLTAHFGLLELGRPRPGDTVVVSAASGAVGQLVGQIAKLAGCRVVAIAGSDDKLQWCREIGFDASINYKTVADITASVKEACPRGVDIFFDNTAGPIHDAVMKNLSIRARVVICGRVALAGQFGKPDIGERFMGHLIVTRASIHGFLVFDWWHRRSEALQRLSSWQRTGQIRFKEDILEGILYSISTQLSSWLRRMKRHANHFMTSGSRTRSRSSSLVELSRQLSRANAIQIGCVSTRCTRWT